MKKVWKRGAALDKNDNIVMISKDIRANERYIRELLAKCYEFSLLSR